jgi:hypothetical protein
MSAFALLFDNMPQLAKVYALLLTVQFDTQTHGVELHILQAAGYHGYGFIYVFVLHPPIQPVMPHEQPQKAAEFADENTPKLGHLPVGFGSPQLF